MFSKLFVAITLAALTGITAANPIAANDIAGMGGPLTPYCCINNCRICSWWTCWGDPGKECADSVSSLSINSRYFS